MKSNRNINRKKNMQIKDPNDNNKNTGKNKALIEEFEKLKKQIRFDSDHTTDRKQRLVNSFRSQAVDRVLTVLYNFPSEITSSAQLKGIKGIGKGSLDRIDEILASGKLSEIQTDLLDQSYLKYIDELSDVYGVGERTAYDLYKKYGVKTVDDLKKLYKAGKISLPDAIVTGLKYYGIWKGDIPHEEIMEIDVFLHDVLFEIHPELFGIICGSYRRLTPTSGDIDMLLVHPEIKTMTSKVALKNNYLALFIDKLKDYGFIVDSLTGEDVSTKYMGFCKFKDYPIRRIDIRFIPYESYYSAILYFTGPAEFNKRMRRLAISMGYSLSEYGLTDENGKFIKVNSEKDIFDALGMEYIPPEKRK